MVWRHTLSVECWRRVHKSQKLISNILERCAAFEDTCCKTKANVTSPLETVCFYTEQKMSDTDFSTYFGEKAMLSFETELVGDLLIEDEYSVKGFTLGAEFAGFFFRNKKLRIIKAVSKESVILYSPRTDLDLNEVGSVLEKVVFTPLKVKCLHLQRLLNILKAQESKTGDDDRKRELKENQTEIDHLIGEIIALFNRSNIEEKLHPVIPGYEFADIDDKVAEGLFKCDESIRGFGYRFNTLHVDIKEFNPQDEVNRQKRETVITDYLKKAGIINIKFHYVSPAEATFKHVGARCRANQDFAALGCFANMTNNQGYATTCALIANHLAIASEEDDGIIYLDNGEKLGSVVANTAGVGGYDIAAVQLDSQDVFSDFRDSERMFCKGNLHKDVITENYKQLQDMSVYMWSDAYDDKPGRGKIFIPRYIGACSPLPHIKVMDQYASRRMAQEGDSGTIICVDDLDYDRVLLISMLKGSTESTALLSDNPYRKRTYTSFSLKKGLDQLSQKTDCKFKLL